MRSSATFLVLAGALFAGCNGGPGDLDGSSDADDAMVAEAAAPDATMCIPEGGCPNDCSPTDAPCWTCQWSYSFVDCRCHATPLGPGCFFPDCSAAGPAAMDEYCGTYWWCNRACAAGLTCRSIADAGAGNYLQTCQP